MVITVVLMVILAVIEIARTRVRHARWDKEIEAEKKSLIKRFEEQQLTRDLINLLSMHTQDTNSLWFQNEIDRFLQRDQYQRSFRSYNTAKEILKRESVANGWTPTSKCGEQ